VEKGIPWAIPTLVVQLAFRRYQENFSGVELSYYLIVLNAGCCCIARRYISIRNCYIRATHKWWRGHCLGKNYGALAKRVAWLPCPVSAFFFLFTKLPIMVDLFCLLVSWETWLGAARQPVHTLIRMGRTMVLPLLLKDTSGTWGMFKPMNLGKRTLFWRMGSSHSMERLVLLGKTPDSCALLEKLIYLSTARRAIVVHVVREFLSMEQLDLGGLMQNFDLHLS